MHLPETRPPDTGSDLRWSARVVAFWRLKTAGMTLGMTVFFIGYFWILHHPHSPPTIMPLTAFDRWIGFRAGALPFYLSLWVYVSLGPALLSNGRELLAYTWGASLLAVLGLAIFFLWPTAMPRPGLDWIAYPGFGFLKSVDATGNACPSLHVAFAVFTAGWLERMLRVIRAGGAIRAVNFLWCAAILHSTMATRQHVFLDVLAGGVLGAVVATVNLRSVPRAAANPVQVA